MPISPSTDPRRARASVPTAAFSNGRLSIFTTIEPGFSPFSSSGAPTLSIPPSTRPQAAKSSALNSPRPTAPNCSAFRRFSTSTFPSRTVKSPNSSPVSQASMADQFHSRRSSRPFEVHRVLVGQPLWLPEGGQRVRPTSNSSRLSAGRVSCITSSQAARKTKSGKDIQNTTTSGRLTCSKNTGPVDLAVPSCHRLRSRVMGP